VSIPWRDDPPGSEARIQRNLEGLVGELARSAAAREVPTVELARSWHRAIFDRVELPVFFYAGGVRDRDQDEPELVDHDVMWGWKLATPAIGSHGAGRTGSAATAPRNTAIGVHHVTSDERRAPAVI
jgi:hypothetical protein